MLIIRELLHWVNHYCYMFFHVDTNPTQYNNFIQTHTFTFANIVYNSLAQTAFEERMDEIRNHGHDCVQRAGELRIDSRAAVRLLQNNLAAMEKRSLVVYW